MHARTAHALARAGADATGILEHWEEVDGGAWVLRPPVDREPVAAVHFVGGAFVGAAPQLTYGAFLQALAEYGVLVVATPYRTSLDQYAVAQEIQFCYDRAERALGDELSSLPCFGLGHSLGALLLLLGGARFAPARAGNVLMSFNCRRLSDAVPLFDPALAPLTEALGPPLRETFVALGGARAREALRAPLGAAAEALPPLARQLLPLVQQLDALAEDFADATAAGDFTPTPDEARKLICAKYAVRKVRALVRLRASASRAPPCRPSRAHSSPTDPGALARHCASTPARTRMQNLLLRFREDDIDETSALAAALLAPGSAASSELDLRVVSLEGGHARPNAQVLPYLDVAVPPEVADAAAASGAVLQGLADSLGPLADTIVAAGVGTNTPVGALAQEAAASAAANVRELGGAFEAASKVGSTAKATAAQNLATEEDLSDLARGIAKWMADGEDPERTCFPEGRR